MRPDQIKQERTDNERIVLDDEILTEKQIKHTHNINKSLYNLISEQEREKEVAMIGFRK